jgi:hypothetical protein
VTNELQVSLDGDDLAIVAEALGLLRGRERKELAKLGALIEEWGPDGHDVLDLDDVRHYETWRRERVTRITELRDRVRGDAQFAELAEIEAIRKDLE